MDWLRPCVIGPAEDTKEQADLSKSKNVDAVVPRQAPNQVMYREVRLSMSHEVANS